MSDVGLRFVGTHHGLRRHHFVGTQVITPDPVVDDWQEEGECRQGHDPEIWYPHTPQEAWLGVAICNTCPVQVKCLEHAGLYQERFGTWGGLTEWQRNRRRQQRRAV